ncbi:hypothetical protein QEH58_10005 [Roseibacillus persicicus]|nr:hypothetical protein [Roseibacillus persicicus]
MKTHTNLSLLLFGLAAGSVHSATWVKGYTAGSSDLTPAGETLFMDFASTGGNDLRFDNGDASGHIWEIQSVGNWTIGDTVEITGLALPFWSNNTNTSNNTQDGTITVSFRSLGVNADYDTGDSVEFGTVATTFASEGDGVDEYFVLFDTPVTWVADSTGFGLSVVSDAALRLKTGPTATGAEAEDAGNGNTRTGYNMSLSIAGKVTPIPEPSAALLGVLGVMSFLVRRR